jgi:hypothetical protein
MGVLKDMQSELNIRAFNFKAKETGERLLISVFNGRLRVTVLPPTGSNQKGSVFTQGISAEGTILFKQTLKKYESMKPNDRHAILFVEWDANNKESKPVASMIFGKDEQQNYYFELQFKFHDNNKVIMFPIMAGIGVQTSTEFSFADRSLLKVQTMIDWFENTVPLACILTGLKYDPSSSGGVSDKTY